MLNRVLGILFIGVRFALAWLMMDVNHFVQSPLNLPREGADYTLRPGTTVSRLARELKQRGYLQQRQGRWETEPDLVPSHFVLPASLEKLIRSRLDILPVELKTVVQRASVIGTPFDVASETCRLCGGCIYVCPACELRCTFTEPEKAICGGCANLSPPCVETRCPPPPTSTFGALPGGSGAAWAMSVIV